MSSTTSDIVPSIPLNRIISDGRIVGCLASLGYRLVSEIQYKAFKSITSGYTTVIISPTGTGKTEAAVFPIAYLIRRNRLKPIAAIYVTPLRALNRDIACRISRICECFGLNTGLRHGDSSRTERRRIRESPPHIIVTTPETFQYLIVDETLMDHLKNLRYIVIDEFRELVASKRGLELLASISSLEHRLGRKIVKVCLTATLSRHEGVLELLDNPIRINVIRSPSIKRMELSITTPSAKHSSRSIDEDLNARLEYIVNSIKEHGSVLIFTNTRDLAERLSYLLSVKGVNVGVHHGSLSREHRLGVERLFKEGGLNAVVATSSLELGIDIGHIKYVIQYMSPRQVVKLIQRVGRSFHTSTGTSRGSIVTLNNIFDILESIAIARRAVEGWVEPEEVYRIPLDVLAHQITARVMAEPGINIDKLYMEFRGNRVFRDIDYDTFYKVIDYLNYTHVIRVKDNRIYPGRRLKQYFYTVTMIPDVRSISVVNVVDNRKVGVLDEEFVTLYCEEGSYIVLGGGLWKVVSYDHDAGKLYVEPAEPTATVIIPRWEGETIPVHYNVAREVGAYMRLLPKYGFNLLKTPIFKEHYVNIDQKSLEIIRDIAKKALTDLGTLPSDNNVVVEVNRANRLIAVYAFLGNRGNNALKEILTALFRRHVNDYVQAISSPFFVLIQFSEVIPRAEHIKKVFDELIMMYRSGSLNHVVERIIRSSSLFLWRVFMVGQRFGAIDPKKAKVTKTLLQGLATTIIGDEAYKESLIRDFDLDTLYKFIHGLAEGRISLRVVERNEPSILLREALNKIPHVSRPYEMIDLETFKERILGREITLICIICGLRRRVRVRDIVDEDSLACPKCGSRAIAPVKGDGTKEERVIKKVLSKQRLTSDEKKLFTDLQKRVTLTLNYGVKAAVVLAGYGVGPLEAQRILNRAIMFNEDVFKLIYEAGKKFLRIKKYLDK